MKTTSRKKPSSGKFSRTSRDSPERYAGSSVPLGSIGKPVCRQSCRSNVASPSVSSLLISKRKTKRGGGTSARWAAK